MWNIGDFWIASDAKSTPTGILVKTYHSVSKILGILNLIYKKFQIVFIWVHQRDIFHF